MTYIVVFVVIVVLQIAGVGLMNFVLINWLRSTDTSQNYRASQVVVDLGWVDFDLRVPPSGPAAQQHLPNTHQPGKSLADRGKIKNHVYDHLECPVRILQMSPNV